MSNEGIASDGRRKNPRRKKVPATADTKRNPKTVPLPEHSCQNVAHALPHRRQHQPRSLNAVRHSRHLKLLANLEAGRNDVLFREDVHALRTHQAARETSGSARELTALPHRAHSRATCTERPRAPKPTSSAARRPGGGCQPRRQIAQQHQRQLRIHSRACVARRRQAGQHRALEPDGAHQPIGDDFTAALSSSVTCSVGSSSEASESHPASSTSPATVSP